jgi:hypothetical protein
MSANFRGFSLLFLMVTTGPYNRTQQIHLPLKTSAASRKSCNMHKIMICHPEGTFKIKHNFEQKELSQSFCHISGSNENAQSACSASLTVQMCNETSKVLLDFRTLNTSKMQL